MEMEQNRNCYPNCDPTIWLRSCKNEIIKPLHGKTSGKIPLWLNGVLYRNGPGLLEIGDCRFDHLFDGLALLHRFSIKNGRATYQCRFLQSETYKRNMRANRIVITDFGTSSVPDPCQTVFKRIASRFNFTETTSDNTMISVYPFGDELYTFTEFPIMYKINKETLKTEEKKQYRENMGIVAHSSHPHVTKDGTVYNLATSMTTTGLYHNIVCFPNKPQIDKNDWSMFDKAHVVAGIPTRWSINPCYMHTFGMTKNYFIIVEQPLSLALPKYVITKFTNRPLHNVMQWHENELVQINVISRRTGKLAYKFYSKAFFYLHIINQYEYLDHIVLDICSYKDPSMIDCMYIDAIMDLQNSPNYADMFRSHPVRFVLPLIDTWTKTDSGENLVKIPNTKAQAHWQNDGTIFVKSEKLCDLGCETPTINHQKYSGTKYRYFYAISSDVDADNPGTVIKVDTVKKTTKTWCEKNCYPSEPIFVPKPNAKREDDGIILAALVWGLNDTNHVGLIVLDAKTFVEIGRAEFHTSSPVPKCLHGWFLPNKN